MNTQSIGKGVGDGDGEDAAQNGGFGLGAGSKANDEASGGNHSRGEAEA